MIETIVTVRFVHLLSFLRRRARKWEKELAVGTVQILVRELVDDEAPTTVGVKPSGHVPFNVRRFDGRWWWPIADPYGQLLTWNAVRAGLGTGDYLALPVLAPSLCPVRCPVPTKDELLASNLARAFDDSDEKLQADTAHRAGPNLIAVDGIVYTAGGPPLLRVTAPWSWSDNPRPLIEVVDRDGGQKGSRHAGRDPDDSVRTAGRALAGFVFGIQERQNAYDAAVTLGGMTPIFRAETNIVVADSDAGDSNSIRLDATWEMLEAFLNRPVEKAKPVVDSIRSVAPGLVTQFGSEPNRSWSDRLDAVFAFVRFAENSCIENDLLDQRYILAKNSLRALARAAQAREETSCTLDLRDEAALATLL